MKEMALPQRLEVIPWTALLLIPSSSADAPVGMFIYTLTAQVSKVCLCSHTDKQNPVYTLTVRVSILECFFSLFGIT